jgi:hypothetical protein
MAATKVSLLSTPAAHFQNGPRHISRRFRKQPNNCAGNLLRGARIPSSATSRASPMVNLLTAPFDAA